MFKKLFPRRPEQQAEAELPVTMSAPTAHARFYEAFGLPRLQLSRKELTTLLQWAVIVVMLMIIYRQSQPVIAQAYMVQEDPVTHEIHLSDRSAKAFKPTEANIHAEARRFARLLWVGDAAQTDTNLEAAAREVQGKAVQELRDFIAKERPAAHLISDPLWTRTPDKISSNLLSDSGTDAAIVRITLTESDKSGEKYQSIVVMTMHYLVKPPATPEEVDRVNGIGFHPTHFSYSWEQERRRVNN